VIVERIKAEKLNQTTEDSYTYTLSVRSSSGHPERTATQAQAKTPHCVCPWASPLAPFTLRVHG